MFFVLSFLVAYSRDGTYGHWSCVLPQCPYHRYTAYFTLTSVAFLSLSYRTLSVRGLSIFFAYWENRTGRISSVKEKERKEEIRAVTAVSFFIALIKSTVWIDFSVYKPQQQGHKTALDDRHDHLFSFKPCCYLLYMCSVRVIMTDNHFPVLRDEPVICLFYPSINIQYAWLYNYSIRV